MKFMQRVKDGGEESHVWGWVFIEIKRLFSIILLEFRDGTREAYHTHAFKSWAWVLKGSLKEVSLTGEVRYLTPSLIPYYVGRDCFHQVSSKGTSWVLNFRGPWANEWKEYVTDADTILTFTHGRKVISGDNRGVKIDV